MHRPLPRALSSVTVFAAAFLLAALPVARAQEGRVQRFNAGLILGLSASQIDGDASAGYNKVGLLAGLRGTVRLGERSDGSIEILYAQRGAQTELFPDDFIPYFRLTLNYIEVPVQWHYKDWLIEDDEESYYRVSLNTGLSYARFMNASYTDEVGFVSALVPDYIKKDDISFLLGGSIFFTRHLGLTIRYVRSIGYIYDPRKYSSPPYESAWSPHELYFQAVYMF
jgi:hypothetical protein